MPELVTQIVQIITCLALIFAAWQILFHARQMHRDMELVYVEQYWRIMMRASPEWRLTNFRGPTTKPKDARVVLDYLQLCEDEIQLRASGRVTDNTWKLWAEAIKFQTSHEPYETALASPTSEGLFMLVRQLRSSSPDALFDPLSRGWFWKKVHGL